MTSFGEYLNNLMQKYHLTISRIATKANIDRTLLSKVISGSRTLNSSTFQNLVSAMELTLYEEETLTELYASSYFGDKKYAKIMILRKFIQNDIHLPEKMTRFNATSGIEEDFGGDMYLNINSQSDFYDAVNKLLTSEMNASAPILYTNYPFDTSPLNRQIFSFLSSCEKKVNFKHLICFKADDRIGSDLIHFLDSLSFARLGYETHYYISGETEHNFDSIFPYYIIATSGIIFYNESATTGIAMRAREFKNKYIDEFSKKISLCRLVAKVLRSPDEVRDFCLPYCTNFHKLQSVGNRLSLYITDETLPLLKYDKSNEQITDYLCTLCDINSHLLLDLNHHDIILYKDAITDFVRTGIIHGINPSCNIYVAEEDRDSFLLYILDYIEQKNVSFRITSDKMNRLARDIMIMVIHSETYKNDVFFTNFPASDDAYDNSYSVLAACNYSIIDDYSNFIEYLKLFSYTENTDTSISYLKSQITFLKKMYSA